MDETESRAYKFDFCLAILQFVERYLSLWFGEMIADGIGNHEKCVYYEMGSCVLLEEAGDGWWESSDG